MYIVGGCRYVWISTDHDTGSDADMRPGPGHPDPFDGIAGQGRYSDNAGAYYTSGILPTTTTNIVTSGAYS